MHMKDDLKNITKLTPLARNLREAENDDVCERAA